MTNVDAREGWEHDDENGGRVLMLRTTESVEVGLWKPNGVAGSPFEYELTADETLVVLRGKGELRVDGGEPIELRPGVVISLQRGCSVGWLVDDEFRELWIYS